MSDKSKTPVTAAVRVLQAAGVTYTEHPYDYVEKGGTARCAAMLGVNEHAVVKTLVMEDDADQPLIVLMHGDRSVSTKNLARQLGAKHIGPCTPETAERHTGYRIGGTSPFGTRKPIPVCIERTILELDRIYINGGHRGFILGMSPHAVVRVLSPTLVEVATEPGK
jgi:Cys-tRNA(Pro) deacylase